jgi:hypothetical protein
MTRAKTCRGNADTRVATFVVIPDSLVSLVPRNDSVELWHASVFVRWSDGGSRLASPACGGIDDEMLFEN